MYVCLYMDPHKEDDLESSGSTSCMTTLGSSSSGTVGEIGDIQLAGAAAEPANPVSSGSSNDDSGRGGAAAEIIRAAQCVGRRNRGGVSWGTSSVIGRRPEMEDAVASVPGFMSCLCHHVGGCTAPGYRRTSGEITPVHFFGVYDGHGGSQVADFCAARMHDVVREEWDREGRDNGPGWHKRWELALCKGFERVDREASSVSPDMSGSTAVVVILSDCQIITSNCGDSRAVLCRGNETIPLTVDQKPDREDEYERIEGGGGKVIDWNGARVLGVLAMSRAIGDWYLRPWIIPLPEISFTTRSEEDECLIVASDGLWEVMTNDEVGEFARRSLRQRRRCVAAAADNDDTSPAKAVADHLTEIAVAKNSSDNVSVIVVDLKPKKRYRQRGPMNK